MNNKFEEEKKAIEDGYTKSFLDAFQNRKWLKYEESGTQYRHHSKVKSKMIMYDFDNNVIPLIYDGSDSEVNEFVKNRGIWVERRNKFYQDCLKEDISKWNFHSLTIYPDGSYESEFIWDEEAHLESLKQNARLWFTYYFEQASLRFVDKCDQLGIEFNFEASIIISFTAGKSNPVLFIAPNHPELNFKLHLDQLHHYIEGDYTAAFEACSLARVRDAYQASIVVANAENYHLMNEGELKGYFPRWNRATAILKPDKDISFEDIQFEWVEENI